jgi:hypothetical protein
MRRTTISLSDELHEELRREASRVRLSIAEVIRLRIQTPAKAPGKRKAVADPLLKVAGICSGPVISANIDDE